VLLQNKVPEFVNCVKKSLYSLVAGKSKAHVVMSDKNFLGFVTTWPENQKEKQMCAEGAQCMR
jgi:hypothetical protein